MIRVLLFAVEKFDFFIYRVFNRIYCGLFVLWRFSFDFDVEVVSFQYVEIKCQLDATDVFYCRSYCFLNMFQALLCPSSGAREYYTVGCCLWYLLRHLFSLLPKSATHIEYSLIPNSETHIQYSLLPKSATHTHTNKDIPVYTATPPPY